MLHGYFRCHQSLSLRTAHALGEGRGGHRTTDTDLCLASAHCRRNRGPLLKYAADFPCCQQKPDDLVFAASITKNNIILEYRGNDACCAICRCCHHPSERCILLIDGKRKT